MAIFSNYNDHAYCKVILDTASLAFFTDNLSTLRSALLRQLRMNFLPSSSPVSFSQPTVWQTLHGMVRDARMRAQDFVTMVIQNIPRETDFGLRQFALNSANSTSDSLPLSSSSLPLLLSSPSPPLIISPLRFSLTALQDLQLCASRSSSLGRR